MYITNKQNNLYIKYNKNPVLVHTTFACTNYGECLVPYETFAVLMFAKALMRGLRGY